MTVSTHVYSARVMPANKPLGAVDGSITLDSAGFPHVTGDVSFSMPDAAQLALLDPRASARVEVTAARDGGTPRVFNLGVRDVTPDRASGVVKVTLASDEALLGDCAQLVDDPTPRQHEASIRALCSYVLGKIGATLQPGGPDADVTAVWAVTNLFPDPSAENPTLAWVKDVAAPNVVRDGNQYAPPLVGQHLLRVQATATTGLSIGQATAVGVQQGTVYTASAYLRSYTGNTKNARLIIRWTGPEGNFIADSRGPYAMTPSTRWDRYVITATAPAGATGARLFIEWSGTHAVGNLHFVDGIMLHADAEPVPLFTGSDPTDAVYSYSWAKDVHGSASTRTPVSVERRPEALHWSAGVSAMDFVHPLLMASGLRLVCDEQRRWTLRDVTFTADGVQAYRYGANIEAAREKLSREAEDWCDAIVYEYIWTDLAGIEQRRIDAFALTSNPAKTIHREVRSAYPGPGRAENTVRRAQTRGREVSVTAVPTWAERTDQLLSILLDGTPIQTGLAASVEYSLDEDTVTVTSRTTDTPAAAWILIPAGQKWNSAPAGATWKNEVI